MKPDFQRKLKFTNFWFWFPLWGLSLLYRFFIRIWLWQYQIGVKKSYPIKKPVISIGNITVGGTGKTPMIDWCLDFLSKKRIDTTVISRGYRAKREKEIQILNNRTATSMSPEITGDEPWLLFQRHPENEFFISPNRIAAAKIASERHSVILLDDAMQHLKLARDLNIVLIDSLSGVGNGHIIPLGPLREPLSGLSRADAIIFTRELNVARKDKKSNRENSSSTHSFFNSEYIPTELISLQSGKKIPISFLEGKDTILFSGIGNPENFESIILQQGAKVEKHFTFTDHVHYDQSKINKLMEFCTQENDDYFIITTEKDWVKIAKWKNLLGEIYCLKMQTVLDPSFQKFFENQLEKLMMVKSYS